MATNTSPESITAYYVTERSGFAFGTYWGASPKAALMAALGDLGPGHDTRDANGEFMASTDVADYTIAQDPFAATITGTRVQYWSVYQQAWINSEASEISDREFAAMSQGEREIICSRTGKVWNDDDDSDDDDQLVDLTIGGGQ